MYDAITETVKVRRDGPKGYRLINKADFDPSVHELFDAPKAEAVEAQVDVECAEEAAPKRRGRPPKSKAA